MLHCLLKRFSGRKVCFPKIFVAQFPMSTQGVLMDYCNCTLCHYHCMCQETALSFACIPSPHYAPRSYAELFCPLFAKKECQGALRSLLGALSAFFTTECVFKTTVWLGHGLTIIATETSSEGNKNNKPETVLKAYGRQYEAICSLISFSESVHLDKRRS